MSLPHLRWAAILLPAGFAMAAQLGLHLLLDPALPAILAHLLTAGIIVAGIIASSLAIFRILEAKEQTLLAQAHQFRTLHEIGVEVATLLEADQLVALVVDRARELLNADAAGLARVGPDNETLYWQHVAAAGGDGNNCRTICLGPGEGVAGYVVAAGQPVTIRDTATDLLPGLGSAPILGKEGLRSALAVPLRSGARTLGALLVANRVPRVFGHDEATLLTSLANQVAVALANAELYAHAQLAAERLERLIESSGDSITTTALDGRILTWNRAAEAIYGWRRGEVIGSMLPMVPPDLSDDVKRIRGLLAGGGILANYETERIRKDGQRISVVVTASPIRSAGGDVVEFLGISRDMSAHRRLERQERKLALLEERERIGMDLHDGAIQSLYAVGLAIEAVAQVLETDPPLARARLLRTRDSVNGAIQDIRNYISGLRRDMFESDGLVAGLEGLAQELRINGLIDLDLDLAEDVGCAFTPERAEDLFQIAREALANVARHAAASQARLSLRSTGGHWMLQIWDNGIGFDPMTVPSTGFGLPNMRVRARRLAGELQVTSRPGEGTEVRLILLDAER